MISSLSKKRSQIVSLFLSNYSTAEELFLIVNHAINDIEKCGLFVEVHVTDNYPPNVCLLKLYYFDQNKLFPAVPQPTCQEKKTLFCLISYI